MKSPDKITINIHMGNSAMRTPKDVSTLLGILAQKFRDAVIWDLTPEKGMDENGNTVATIDYETD